MQETGIFGGGQTGVVVVGGFVVGGSVVVFTPPINRANLIKIRIQKCMIYGIRFENTSPPTLPDLKISFSKRMGATNNGYVVGDRSW